MRRVPLVVLLGIFLLSMVRPAGAEEETLQFGRFGTVTLYGGSPRPSHVVLFVSGDGGWNLGVVDMARELVTLDALVVVGNLKEAGMEDEPSTKRRVNRQGIRCQ